jgi:hypothetical protein
MANERGGCYLRLSGLTTIDLRQELKEMIQSRPPLPQLAPEKLASNARANDYLLI